MGQDTKIEWATHSLNFWEGCTKVSPGCANCYAEARNARFGGGKAPNWGAGAPRRLTSVSNWMQADRWDRMARASGERPRVFVNSLADILDPEVPIEWLAKAYDVMRRCTALDFLLVTKRPELWTERTQAAHDAVCLADPVLGLWLTDWIEGTAPRNVWVGVTVEDQARADARLPELIEIPAAVRFLSVEPLLGLVGLGYWLTEPVVPQVHWVIVGGESGHRARAMHPKWVREIRDECALAGVPFFFKQWGEWLPASQHNRETRGGAVFEWSDDYATKVGKADAGRLLDGVEHNAVPEVAA